MDEPRKCGPLIHSAGRWGSWAHCWCGWAGPTVWGAGQASISWALHVRDRLKEKA